MAVNLGKWYLLRRARSRRLLAGLLNPLLLSKSSVVLGSAESGTILGTTLGSTLTASGLPVGLTINSVARTWSYSGAGTIANYNFTITETPLVGNPRISTISFGITDTAVSAVSASRMLSQAGLSAKPNEVTDVQTQGIAGWIDSQMATPRTVSFWDSVLNDGYGALPGGSAGGEAGFDHTFNKYLFTTSEHLRARTGLALLNWLVMGMNNLSTTWRPFQMMGYLDILWDNAFGNFRDILEAMSRNPAMATYLTFLGSKKENGSGNLPDENYARELLQLFTIGEFQLNNDGTLAGGATPIAVYTLEDVKGLARVFTGWTSTGPLTVGDDLPKRRNPCILVEADHELGTKTFLGQTLPAYVSGSITTYANTTLVNAINVIFNHANLPPFVCKRLIMGLVTSNPSQAYVSRITSVFLNNGLGVRGDLKAVVRAILLDTEARNDVTALASTTFGKLREPAHRFIQLFRTLNFTSPTGTFGFAKASDTGQVLGRSPTVFNHFKVDYSPPNSNLFANSLVAPAFQVTDEVTAINYVNQLQILMREGSKNLGQRAGNGIDVTNQVDLLADYTQILAIEPNTDNLIAYFNLAFAANQVSAPTIALIKSAVDSVVTPTAPVNNVPLQRIQTVAIMILSSPEYLGQK